ncbi:50S ribosomal protein L29 [Candidatus Pacearchaeota archaeon]|nr:50S ribosomal protein L29 [Candidatus Pacearchaeota archaeon]
MAIIRKNEMKKMNNKDRKEKIKELRSELMKERVNLSKGGKIKVKEIKRTIARLLTFNSLNKSKTVGTK